MFNNLIESTSHAREYKRRGSFLLFTTGVYAVLLLLAGVASIYAYDAHLEAQTTQLELLSYVPLDPLEQQPTIISDPRPTSNRRNALTEAIRTEFVDNVSNPTNVPVDVGVTASRVPPVPPGGARLGPVNLDPPAPSFTWRVLLAASHPWRVAIAPASRACCVSWNLAPSSHTRSASWPRASASALIISCAHSKA